MARPLRIEYPGACYHVMNRGVGRHRIFHGDSDCKLFLDRLEESAESYQVEVRSYCLMANHFHLYLCTPEANLAKFMQAFLTSYSVIKNRRDPRTGHLFQGRYKSHLVEDECYGNRVSRYIHLNPVRVKSLTDASIEEKQRFLRCAKWSSYASIIGLRRCPKWLDRNSVLRSGGVTLKDKQRNYAGYVEKGLMQDIENPFDSAAAQFVVGSDSFIDWVRRTHLDVSDEIRTRREQQQARQLAGWVDFSELLSAISHTLNCDESALLEPYSRGFEPRQVLLFLASKYCRGRYSIAELAEQLNISAGGLTSGRYKFQQRLKTDRALAKRVAKIENTINRSGNNVK